MTKKTVENAFKKDWTEEELKQFAVDLQHGKIFTSNHIRPGEAESVLGSIFMPLFFMDKKTHAAFMAAEPAVLFEYYDKAGPRSVNGYPGFTSFQFFNQKDWDKVMAIRKALEEAEKKVLDKPV